MALAANKEKNSLVKAYNWQAKNIMLSSRLQAVAEHNNLTIKRLTANKYVVQKRDGTKIDIDSLSLSNTENESGVFDLPNLKSFLSGLHQPIEVSVSNYRDEKGESKRKTLGQKAYETFIRSGEVDEARTLTHQALRFLQNGSAIIPPDPKRKVEVKVTEDCHITEEEASMRAREWHNNHEFGHFEKGSISSIQASAIDPSYGFGFKVERSQKKHSFDFSKRDELENELNSILEKIYVGEPDQNGFLWFKGIQLEALSREIVDNQDKFEALIVGAEREERQQHERLVSIRERAESLKSSASFQRQKLGILDSEKRIDTLLATSTFLTPAVEKTVMNEMWARKHWTQNFMSPETSPVLALKREYQNLFDDLAAIKAENPSPEMYSALVFEHYELLAFSKELTTSFAAALHENKDKELAQKAEELKNVALNIHHAGVSGVHFNADEMNEEYQEILEDVQSSLGIGPGMVKRFGKNIFEGGKEFLEETGYHFVESPLTAALAGALLVYLVSSRPEDSFIAANGKTYLYSQVPEEFWPRERSGSHMDFKYDDAVGTYRWVKHIVTDSVISGPVLKLMEWSLQNMYAAYEAVGLPTNRVNVFDAGFTTGADYTGKKIVDANLLQDATHSGYWVVVSKLGLTDKMQGFGKIIKLAGPLVDPMVVMHKEKPWILPIMAGGFALGAVNGYDAATADAANQMSDVISRTMSTGIATSIVTLPSALIPAKIKPKKWRWKTTEKIGHEILDDIKIAQEVGECVAQRLEVEQSLPEVIRRASLDMKIGGVKEQFTIGARNLKPLLNALDKYEIALEHMAEEVGFAWSKQKKVRRADDLMSKEIVTQDFTWYQEFLVLKLRELRAALEGFQAGGNVEQLQAAMNDHVEDLIGAQLRKQEQADLYEALTGREISQKATKSLLKQQKRTFNAKSRREAIKNRWGSIADSETVAISKILKESTLIAGTAIYDVLVKAKNALISKPLENVPKTQIACLAGMAATTCVLITIGTNGAPEYVSAVADYTGRILGGASTMGIGVPVNIVQDVLQNHVGGGVVALGGGAAVGVGAVAADRLTGNNLGKVFKKAARFIQEKSIKLDHAIGNKTKEAAKWLQGGGKDGFGLSA